MPPAAADSRELARRPVADQSPFHFPGDRRGILLVHGFVGSPFEMRLLGESLAARGFTVSGPRLAGHAQGRRDVGGTSWPDWYGSVEKACEKLRGECDVVGVAGLSLGGLLAFELAWRKKHQIAAVASLAAPLWLPRWQTRIIRTLATTRYVQRMSIPRLLGSDIADPVMKKLNPNAPGGMPIRALDSLLGFMQHIRRTLSDIDRPTLVVHSRKDHTAPYASSDMMLQRLRGPVERVTLERSYHVITLDVEREEVFARVGEYFEKRLAIPGSGE